MAPQSRVALPAALSRVQQMRRPVLPGYVDPRDAGGRVTDRPPLSSLARVPPCPDSKNPIGSQSGKCSEPKCEECRAAWHSGRVPSARVARYIAAGTRKAGNQPYPDWVADGAEHDRNCCRHFFGCYSGRSPGRYDDLDLLSHQVFCEVIQTFRFPVRRPALDDDGLSFHIAELCKLAQEGHGKGRAKTGI